VQLVLSGDSAGRDAGQRDEAMQTCRTPPDTSPPRRRGPSALALPSLASNKTKPPGPRLRGGDGEGWLGSRGKHVLGAGTHRGRGLLLILLLTASCATRAEDDDALACAGPDRAYASELVPPSLLSGPWHTLSPCVQIVGHMAQFELESPFGTLQVEGVALLATRIEELPAVATLEEATHAGAFGGASMAGVEQRAGRLGRILLNPIDTAREAPEGARRFLQRQWDRVADAGLRVADRVSSVTEEGQPYRGVKPPVMEREAEDERGWGERNLARGQKLTLDWLGYGKTRRALAERLGVDPYSSNPWLRERLDQLAWSAFGGEKALSMALGALGPAAGTTLSMSKRIDEVVWRQDPEQVAERNGARLVKHGCPDAEVRAFLRRGSYSPTRQSAFVDALLSLSAERDCGDLLVLAAHARNEFEASYLTDAMRMLQTVPLDDRPARLVLIGTGVALERGSGEARSLVLPLPIDRLQWTSAAQAYFEQPEFGVVDKTLLLAGGAELPALQVLTRRGWQVDEFVAYPRSPPYAR